MKLRRLTLHGFKSFADRTELRFHDGITVIVGPNGCGKSNISDAIRWVLGEQRASAIRSARMDEAIFQGTVERRPVSRAEVALIFSNEARRLALPYDEIEMRRTVFREGGSEYELNRAPCRLRDILDLCRDTGLGANAYAVIEQGMVDAILSDRADERRHLFEEAAGIGRYKDRRRAAQRRLELAESDLARLEDVIGEVESKVRSLARQQRRARRFDELRQRRLALELAVALGELQRAGAALDETAARLASLTQEEAGARAALAAAEVGLEAYRLRSADAARERGELAGRLAERTGRLTERERELALADERGTHAERRLAQIGAEREELRRRAAELEEELRSLGEARAGEQAVLEQHAERLAGLQARQQVVRAELEELRHQDSLQRSLAQELIQRLAKVEGDAAAAGARVGELEARLSRLDGEQRELEAEWARLEEQRDLFGERVRELASAHAELEAEHREGMQRVRELEARDDRARHRLADAEEQADLLAGRIRALEALERDFHGFAPAVAAALAAQDRLEGLVGPVARLLELPPATAAAVEATLGSLLQALVVRDAAAGKRVRDWLAQHAADKGPLALLPQDALPRLEALLEAFEFAGSARGEPAILGRAERVAQARSAAEAAARARDEEAGARVAAAELLAGAETARRELESRLSEVEAVLRRAQADDQSRALDRERVQRANREVERRHAELQLVIEEARQAQARAAQDRTSLEAERAHFASVAEASARGLAEQQLLWEQVRDEESEIRVAHARAESAAAGLEQRLVAVRQELTQTGGRRAALDNEEAEHRRALGQLEGLHADAGAALEELFQQRDALAGELRAVEERLSATSEATAQLEGRIRGLRAAAEELTEQRHRIELERAGAESAHRAIRERLEGEWGRPFQQLLQSTEPAKGEPEALRAELQAVAADLERLGPVNMLAMEEHAEESRRLEFLTTQREDLRRARDDLQAAIRQINRTARQMFIETFEQIRANCRRTFETLFEGGECDVWLENPEDPLESTIEISASPRGKRTQRIHLLSGGERALTALALLFAIYLVKPSPFCVLDEVDAPLDEANIGRFLAMVGQFKAETQFIVITHNPRTMEAADWIYGVTMEEPGVSSVVGVRLEDVIAGAQAVS